MLGKFRFTAAAAAVALGSLGFVVAGPASAHPDPANLTCTIVAATASVQNQTHQGKGLYYPVTDDPGHIASGGDDFTWQLGGTCAEGYSFSSSGFGKGWCGRSVGNGGGTIAGHNYTVNWESVGTQLILTHPSAAGSVNANPLATTGSCTTGDATAFLVSGTLTHTLN